MTNVIYIVFEFDETVAESGESFDSIKYTYLYIIRFNDLNFISSIKLPIQR